MKYLHLLIVALGVIGMTNCTTRPSAAHSPDNMDRSKNKSATDTSKIRPAEPLSDERYRHLNDKLLSGIDFVASGNEPFWSLKIDFDKSMHFKMADGFEMITPAVKGIKAMDADVTRYTAHTEKGILTVQVQKLNCINDMSGQKSAYTIQINTKANDDKEYKTFDGCGHYLSDYRLHDIWVLEAINNTKLNSRDFTKGQPTLEINLTDNKIFGHTGCNRLNGSMEVQGKNIVFSRLITTRMACDNTDFENRYVSSLSNRTLVYKIEGGKLHLQVNGDSTFVYHKTD